MHRRCLDCKSVTHVAYDLTDRTFTRQQGCSDDRLDLYYFSIDELHIARTLSTDGLTQYFKKCPELGHLVRRLPGPILCHIHPIFACCIMTFQRLHGLHHNAWLFIPCHCSSLQLTDTGSQGVTFYLPLISPLCERWTLRRLLVDRCTHYTNRLQFLFSCAHSLLPPMQIVHFLLNLSLFACQPLTQLDQYWAVTQAALCQAEYIQPSIRGPQCRTIDQALHVRQNHRTLFTPRRRSLRHITKSKSPSSSPATVGTDTTTPLREGSRRSSPNTSLVVASRHHDCSAKRQTWNEQR